MKAITTKYHGPMNTRGSRISASDCEGNRISISYPHELNSTKAHRKAAQTLCDKMAWPWPMVGGHTKDGMVFVFVPALKDHPDMYASVIESE
jgi:hypothetical protein